MGLIALEGMEFFAYHGVYPEERASGQWFRVELELTNDFSKAAQSDDLSDALDYVAVYEVLKEEMAIPAHLLEHLAHRINKRLKQVFPAIEKLRIKITKMQPPIEGKLAGISIVLED
ncbi:MAG: dihydroneopterin aldolase [Bacteroidota bacterium]|jgi:dihydroneopterin aldolase